MSKDTITREEYLMLQGLFTLGQHYKEKLDDTVDEARRIVGDTDEFGSHIEDEIWGRKNSDLDRALDRMNIKVEE